MSFFPFTLFPPFTYDNTHDVLRWAKERQESEERERRKRQQEDKLRRERESRKWKRDTYRPVTAYDVPAKQSTEAPHMLMLVLHDPQGREMYVNPAFIAAVYPASDAVPTATSGSVIAFSGSAVQVKEAPGAVYYLLKQVSQLHD